MLGCLIIFISFVFNFGAKLRELIVQKWVVFFVFAHDNTKVLLNRPCSTVPEKYPGTFILKIDFIENNRKESFKTIFTFMFMMFKI